MPYHDLNLVYHGPAQTAELQQTLAFAIELGYSVVAFAVSVSGKLPSTLPPVPVSALNKPANVTLLSRLTLTISDTSQNHRLSSLQSQYNLLALRPTNDKSFQLCCSSLECDLISLDLSQRLPFILKFKTVSAAMQRGIRFEICYSPGIDGGTDAKRNVISGATSLIRATRGKGIILSSEARSALSLRGPHDVMNLAQVWGLGQERGKEGICEDAARVVKLAELKRDTYRGVVSIVKGTMPTAKKSDEHKPSVTATEAAGVVVQASSSAGVNGIKRKASETSLNAVIDDAAAHPPLSKREMKRRAKKARSEAQKAANDEARGGPKTKDAFPIPHESLTVSAKKKS